LHIHGPGDLVAEAAIFDSMVYPASCMALEKSALVRISRDGILDLIRKHPELALKMMSGYSKRLRQFVARIEELSLKDMKARLAGYLLANSNVENGETVFRLRHSKKELSSLLGTIPETLSRALAFLKQNKLITEAGNKITIPDAEKLRVFSEQ
jgi:CRP/FNR family transcriptional regulator, dissimilatory nitrate respiration regulator